ncbi:GPW/gp25 family protein [Primorskyibacter sp. 2E107]|uniref:GPW/gp25 family protein n=1 Tax=Primorskyibacter sp. 2E107 TaxID=3403458 RepID=UPI003AF83986
MLRPTRKSSVARNLLVPMGVDRSLGALRTVTDAETQIKSLLMQLLMTDPGERVMRPEFGTGIRGMVFEPLRQASSALVKAAIYGAVQAHLGDVVKLQQVKVEVVESTLIVEISYAITLAPEPQFLNLEVPL